MSFLSILIALLIEQARPLTTGNAVHAGMRGWLRWVVRQFDAGEHSRGWLPWGVAVVLPALVAAAVHWLLLSLPHVGGVLAALWCVLVLYAALGFRQFSHHFTDIRDALLAGDDEQARKLLSDWRQVDASGFSRQEIIRQVIQHSVLAAHRHVFGVLSWFVVLAALGLGPAGAVLYRLSEFVARYWPYVSRRQRLTVSAAVCAAAERAWYWVDWIPVRLTVAGFAVVGSFEETVDSWRRYAALPASRGPGGNDGLIVAATEGAINIRLGADLSAVPDGEIGVAVAGVDRYEPQMAHLRSMVGLVWRSVVMWMLLLALLTLARWLG